MLKTIARLNEFHAAAGTTEPSLLNFAATDGHSVICTRYVSSRSDEAASLFFRPAQGFTNTKKADSIVWNGMIAAKTLSWLRASL
jgi:glutamine amidotransferase